MATNSRGSMVKRLIQPLDNYSLETVAKAFPKRLMMTCILAFHSQVKALWNTTGWFKALIQPHTSPAIYNLMSTWGNSGTLKSSQNKHPPSIPAISLTRKSLLFQSWWFHNRGIRVVLSSLQLQASPQTSTLLRDLLKLLRIVYAEKMLPSHEYDLMITKFSHYVVTMKPQTFGRWGCNGISSMAELTAK